MSFLSVFGVKYRPSKPHLEQLNMYYKLPQITVLIETEILCTTPTKVGFL